MLQEKQQTAAGLHTFTILGNRLSTGIYFIRLATYTASGSQAATDDLRFAVVK